MRAGWEYKKLGEVCKITSGFTPKPSELSSLGKYPYFKVADMNTKGNEVYLSVTPAYVDNTKKTFPSQSIVFPKNGATIATNKKRILAQDSIVDLNTAVAFFSEEIIPKYSFYWFTNIDFREYTRGGALPTLDLKLLKDTIFPLPPIPQQRLIVSELDEINSLIALKREQLKKYDELAQSLFYEMFGDPVENEKGWEVKKLGEICIGKLKYGSGASAVEFNGRVRYVRITDIKEDGTLNKEAKSPSQIEDDYLLQEGDILFARSGATVGKTYIHQASNISCVYAGYLIKAVPNRDVILPLYLYSYTKSNFYRTWIDSNARTVAQPNINAKQYSDLLVPLPPLSLQQTFAQRIEQIEEQKKQVTAAIAKLETLLASRMQYWFE